MPGTRHGVALVITRLDTAAMTRFLAELGQAVAPGLLCVELAARPNRTDSLPVLLSLARTGQRLVRSV